jgi:hypothetical protein
MNHRNDPATEQAASWLVYLDRALCDQGDVSDHAERHATVRLGADRTSDGEGRRG